MQLNQTQPSPLTVLLQLNDSGVTRRTSFKLQQCCHYFVSNPCRFGSSTQLIVICTTIILYYKKMRKLPKTLWPLQQFV